MPTVPQSSHRRANAPFQNVAQRLAQAVGTAKEMGFEVRKVVFDEQTPGWCQIGQKKILFLDLAASTSEQLTQLDDIIASYCNQKGQRDSGKLAA